jgi:acyl-CoA oxidase
LQVKVCARLLEQGTASGLSPEDAWNRASVQLTQAAESHCRAFLVHRYVDSVRTGMNNLSPELQAVMLQLCELYAVYWALLRTGDFLLVSNFIANVCYQILNLNLYFTVHWNDC